MRISLPLVVVLAAIVVAVLIVRAYFSESGPGFGGAGGGPARLAGAPAVSYPIPRLGGTTDALASYRGKVVLVNLWATWCAPCRSETPALEKLYEHNKARGFVVLGIDQGESAQAAQGFVREFDLRYPILLDEEQRYGRAYAAVGLPTSIVVDRTGHIVRGVDGEMTLAQMQDAIAPALRAQ